MPAAKIRAYNPNTPKTKLLHQVRETIRRKHYSLRTEATYVDWIKRYIFFHHKRHRLRWARAFSILHFSFIIGDSPFSNQRNMEMRDGK
jgi:hypothetical protein